MCLSDIFIKYAQVALHQWYFHQICSSGFASLWFLKGRTTHSIFRIPLNVTKDLICRSIEPNSKLIGLLKEPSLTFRTKLQWLISIALKALNMSVHDDIHYLNDKASELSFRYKAIVFGGDFRLVCQSFRRVQDKILSSALTFQRFEMIARYYVHENTIGIRQCLWTTRSWILDSQKDVDRKLGGPNNG